jgi:hypothetical protein
VPALTEPSEARFDDTNPAHYELFGVRYVVSPADHAAPPGGVVIASAGRHRLWQVPSSGYVSVIDITAPIASTRQGVDVATAEFLRSRLPLEGKYPSLALADDVGAAPAPAGPRPGQAGSVESSRFERDADRFTATVTATRDAAVLVKVSFHGRWHATVDGVPARTAVVAPGLLAVPVAAGRHTVDVTYRPVSGFTYGALFALAVAVLGLLAALDRRTRQRPRQPSVVVVDRPGRDVLDDSVAVVAGDVVAGAAVVAGAVAGTRDASVGSSLTAAATD